MADVKWIKITTDMFDNRKIRHLRRLPEGNNIVLIWVMLLTMAGRCNSNGMIFLTENIPYTPKMLADELDFEENTVILALEALVRMEMIVMDENYFTITGWEEHQNIEGMGKIREQNRIRKQRQRERQKILLEDSQMSRDSSREVTQQNKNKNKNKNNIKDNVHSPSDYTQKVSKTDINNLFERVWRLYPNKKGKGQVKDAQKKRLYDIGYEELERSINRYVKDLSKETWRKPQNGSTFFNSGYVDYLDANYEETESNTNGQDKRHNHSSEDYSFDPFNEY